jgi:hypothetical protein
MGDHTTFAGGGMVSIPLMYTTCWSTKKFRAHEINDSRKKETKWEGELNGSRHVKTNLFQCTRFTKKKNHYN